MASKSLMYAVFLIIGILIGGIAVYAVTSTSSVSNTSSSATKVYYIGDVVDLTGSLAASGQNFVLSAQLAINQMNQAMNASGNHIEFKLESIDSKGTPEGSLAALQTLYQTYHIAIDVGPISSSELAGMLSYANTNHILLIGPTSNAGSLAIPNDYLFRPDAVPATYEAQALVAYAQHENLTNLVIVYRDDTFGGPFYNSSVQYATADGIKTMGISYAPGQSDYAGVVSTASSDVQEMQSSGKTGVLWIDFLTEAQNMFTHAASDPTLSSVNWIGIDDLVDPAIAPPNTPAAVGQALVHSNFTAAASFVVANPISQAYIAAFTAAYGSAPLSYSETFYDGTMLACLDLLYSGVYNGTVLQQNFPTVSDHFIGVDGQTYLDANGDQGIGDFQLSQLVTNSSGGYVFQNDGYFDGSSAQLVLNSTG
jgi:branched-chain amino acid transport system substrate-binding protein